MEATRCSDARRAVSGYRRSVLCVVGTRPEAIKVAPVVRQFHAHGWDPVVVTTGQHGAVAVDALAAFDLAPDIRLEEWTRGADLADLHVELVRRLADIIGLIDPAVVLVQGDTASTLAGALAGFWAQVPVVHLEAGLRSGSLDEPFPEEANRRMVTQVAAVHLAPTRRARSALLAEGIDPDLVFVTGNTVVDAVRTLAVGSARHPRGVENTGASMALVTCHRRENWGRGVERIGAALRRLVEEFEALEIVVAAHPNPSVRQALEGALGGSASVCVRGAVDYPEFIGLLAQARVVVTDSGGVQEEAAALGVPAVVTRRVTERQEGVDAGLAVLVGTEPDRIVDAVRAALTRADSGIDERWCPYGDGRAAERTVAAVGWLLEGTDRPVDFTFEPPVMGAVA